MSNGPDPQPELPSARERILDAAARAVIETGWAAATSGRLSRQTGVSKALIHYHFRDKDALLSAVATRCRERLLTRVAPAGTEASAQTGKQWNPVDGFATWFEGEVAADELRIAVRLRGSGAAVVTRAADQVVEAFRAEVGRRIRSVFRALGLTPRIPLELLVDLFGTVAEGMAAMPARPTPRRRPIVETLWLSVLSLAD